MRGVVKWFDQKKGYGFITDMESGKDIFVHYTGVIGNGFKMLEKDDVVSFTVHETARGISAVDVVEDLG